MIEKVLIIGSGFMGTSIAQASDLTEISCVENNQEHIAELQKKNLYKSIYQSLDEVQDRFDLVIICTRQDKVLHFINEVSKQEIGTYITDIASSKNFLKEALLPDNFISSHPICGSHKTGPIESEKKLFADKEVILIKDKTDNFVNDLKNFWESLGSNVSFMNLEEHNKNYAYLSHFPHFFSFIYEEILQEENIDYEKYSGDSLKEILRLSKADKNLWSEIFEDNKTNLEDLKEKIRKKLS